MAVGDLLQWGQWRFIHSDSYLGTIWVPLETGFSTNPYTWMLEPVLQPATNSSSIHWVEARCGGKKAYIAKNHAISGISLVDARRLINDSPTLTIAGDKYKLSLIAAEDWIGLPTEVTNKLTYIGLPFLTNTNTPNSALDFYTVEQSATTKKFTLSDPYSSTSFSSSKLFVPVLVCENSIPTVSGADVHLGDKTSAFSISYSVSDADSGQELTVKEKLNGTIIKTIHNPEQNKQYFLEITDSLFAGLTTNSDASIGIVNTIEIEVTDGVATTYRRYTFNKTNSVPYIAYTGQLDLGEMTEKPAIIYQVNDGEGDKITVTEKLNGATINTFTASQNTDYTVGLTDLFWLTCGSDTNTIEIIAEDAQGGNSSKLITFCRQINKVQIATKNAILTDIAATKILVSPQWDTTGCTGTVEVCNNGFDKNPTWENATTMVALNRPYVFNNVTKTADNWGIKVRLTLVKNDGYEGAVAIYGFGGAYE